MRSIAVGGLGRSEGSHGSGSAHHRGELLRIGIEDFVRLRVDEETHHVDIFGVLHNAREEEVKRLAHRHTALHRSGENAFALRSFAHGINPSCHIIVERLRRIGLIQPCRIGEILRIVGHIVCLHVRSHLVFHEDVLHAERGVGTVEP